MTKREGYCPHGVYVGGIGVDWMCGRCESGDDELTPPPRFVERPSEAVMREMDEAVTAAVEPDTRAWLASEYAAARAAPCSHGFYYGCPTCDLPAYLPDGS